jgi:hypothetical protein
MMQTAMTLLFGTAQDARVPELDRRSQVLTSIFPVFLVRVPGWIFRGDGAPWPSSRGILLACKGSRMPTTKMRIGLVSGIVNTDTNNQY